MRYLSSLCIAMGCVGTSLVLTACSVLPTTGPAGAAALDAVRTASGHTAVRETRIAAAPPIDSPDPTPVAIAGSMGTRAMLGASATAQNTWSSTRRAVHNAGQEFGRTAHKIASQIKPMALSVSGLAESAPLENYAAACLANSRLVKPRVVGKSINTPRYAIITMQRPDNNLLPPLKGGELCVVNKVTQLIEVTAVDDLNFMSPEPEIRLTPKRRR